MTDAHRWIALALLVCGLALMAVGVAKRREKRSAFATTLVVTLAAAAVLAWVPVALSAADAMDLHHAARNWSSATVFTMALAGALAFVGSRAARYASVPLVAAGFFTGFLGSTTFLDRFVNDPFLAFAEPVTVTTLSTDALAEFPVPFQVSNLWLSPAGEYVAFGSEDRGEELTIHAGRVGGPLADFTADEALFVDEGRVLLLERQRDASVLRVVDLQGPNHEVWSRRVPLTATSLWFDRTSRTWRLLGWSGDDEIASAVGRIESDAIREQRWSVPADDARPVEPLAVSNGDLLALETLYPTDLLNGSRLRQWLFLFAPYFRTDSRFWTVGAHGRSTFAASRLALTCRTSMDGAGATCIAFDGTRTRVFAVDAAKRQVTALASVPGQVQFRSGSGGGWMTGWWDCAPVLLRAETREAIRIGECDGQRPYHLVMTEKVLGAMYWSDRGSTLRLYSAP